MKILHSADWHLDSPLVGKTSAQSELLKSALLSIPGKVARLCRQEQADLLLLSGDLFDGPCSRESLQALKTALEEVSIPTFIAPGNHDFCTDTSPWRTEVWPENVHIFTRPAMESIAVPALDCRVYGAGFVSMDCPGLLENFCAEQEERYAIGILHGDPTSVRSPYCPITAAQIQHSGLDYLALGHIHKGGSLRAGRTLCAWPGCPMGRGFDELGEKGVLLVTLEDCAEARFIPLDTPRFYELEADVGAGPQTVLPAVGNNDFYRIHLTGEAESLSLEELAAQFPQFPNLELRDKTTPPIDLWASAVEDTLEGVYFRLLQEALGEADEDGCRRIRLAARISRQILDGQEVKLP